MALPVFSGEFSYVQEVIVMMAAVSNTPAWYGKEEAECFEKIKELAKRFPQATALVIEMEGSSQVLIECREELTNTQNMQISRFNKERNGLLVDYVTEDEHIEGKRYPL